MGHIPDAELAALLASYARRPVPGRIALVGNAPVPPSPQRAASIDGADLVVRLNSFALDEPGGPAALGRRTDVVTFHRGVVASPWTFADHTARLYLLAESGRMFWETDWKPTWIPPELGHVAVPNDRFPAPLRRLLGFDDEREAAWATTGTGMAYLLLELFPAATVLMAGFSIVDRPDQRSFDHAWGTPVTVTPEHRLQAEADLLRGWAAEGRIEFL